MSTIMGPTRAGPFFGADSTSSSSTALTVEVGQWGSLRLLMEYRGANGLD